MSTNHLSPRTPDDIQAMLDDVSSSSPHSAATASAAASPSSRNPGESSLSEGGLLATLKEENRRVALSRSASKVFPVILITPSTLEDLCCGFIGSHKGTFCLKPKSVCPVYLKQGSHYFFL